MAIIESWYLGDIQLIAFPVIKQLTFSRRNTFLGEQEHVTVHDEDTIIIRRGGLHFTNLYTIDAPNFVTEVDELMRLRHLPEYIHHHIGVVDTTYELKL